MWLPDVGLTLFQREQAFDSTVQLAGGEDHAMAQESAAAEEDTADTAAAAEEAPKADAAAAHQRPVGEEAAAAADSRPPYQRHEPCSWE